MIIKPMDSIDRAPEKDPHDMNRAEIQQKICEIILEQLISSGNQKLVILDDIKPESSFIDDLGADSLDIVEIFTAIEEMFELIIPADLLEQMTVVKDAVNYLASRV